MPSHANKGSARGNAQLFVVIAMRSAGGEGLAQPVAILRRHLIGAIGPACRALIGRDYQIGIVVVIDDRQRRPHYLCSFEIVS